MNRSMGLVALLVCTAAALAFAGGQSGAQGEGATAEKMTITWLGMHYVEGESPPADGNMVETMIEERFGVEIQPIPISRQENDKLAVWFADGNSADLMIVRRLGDLLKQGLVRSYSYEWLQTYMPDWVARLHEVGYGEERLKSEMLFEGKYYSIPFGAGASYYTAIVRKDWMDNLGITSTRTIPEWEEMLRAFTVDDPDGNGKDDTYGFSSLAMWLDYAFGWLFAAFGNPVQGSYFVRDGKVHYSSATEEYKEGLKVIARWWANGWIEPEFIDTNAMDTCENRFAEGKFGVCTEDVRHGLLEVAGLMADKARLLNPKAEVVAMAGPAGPDREGGIVVVYPNLFSDGYGGLFGRNTSDEKVKMIMQIKNALLADEAMYLKSAYGVEGKHWFWDENNVLTLSRDEMVDAHRSGVNFYISPYPRSRMGGPDKGAAVRAALEWSLKQPYVLSGRPETFPLRGENTALTQKGGDIQTVYEEFFFKALTGKVDIESEWPDYLKMLDRAGLQEVIAQYEQLRS